MSSITTTPAGAVSDVSPQEPHPGVKQVRFEFDTSRQVPFYRETLQRLTTDNHYQALALKAGVSKLERGYRYWLGAQGEQTDLGAFADTLAQAFPLSCFLLDARVCAADDEAQEAKELLQSLQPLQPQPENAPTLDTPKLAFCGHCYPRFGDNQSPEFGKLDLVCPHCHGERYSLQSTCESAHESTHESARESVHNSVHENAHKNLAPQTIGLDTLKSFASMLMDGQAITLEGTQYQLGGNPLKDSLICCNPNNLSASFIVTDAEVLALSGIEKPRLRLRPQSQPAAIPAAQPVAPSYRVRFANSRAELVLCELLRVKGIDFVFAKSDEEAKPELDICQLNGVWHVLYENAQRQLPYAALLNPDLSAARMPEHSGVSALHELAENNGYIAKLSKSAVGITIKPAVNKGSHLSAPSLLALKGLTLCHGKALAHQASLYLGGKGPLEIATVDAHGKEEVFFSQSPLPDNGYDIYRILMESPQRTVLEKFKGQYPQECLAMLDILFAPTAERGNLQCLWAVAACILGLGLGREKPSVAFLADALISEAQKFTGQTAPRIDYPLVRGEALRSINWCKTLGTLMSFRLAGDDDKPKLAFAMMDSLADYLANWIEHLDLNVGVHKVWLSGSELANSVLAKRLWLRLGKNFPIETNPEQDLDGALFAIGALFTETPRRFGALGREPARKIGHEAALKTDNTR